MALGMSIFIDNALALIMERPAPIFIQINVGTNAITSVSALLLVHKCEDSPLFKKAKACETNDNARKNWINEDLDISIDCDDLIIVR